VDTGSLLATTHQAGELRVRLRLARPSDALSVRAFLETQRPALAGSVRRFTFFDPRERLVLLATTPRDGAEQIVGLVEAGEGPPLVLGDEPELVKLLTTAGSVLAARVRKAA
jgi:hypothetical protein